MPQPLPKSLSAQISLTDVARHRQELALNAANVISKWATIDALVGALIPTLINADPRPAAAVFDIVKNFEAKMKALREIAIITIPDEKDRDILNAILRLYASTARGRNTLAHHLWGIHDKIPDGILMVDPKIIARVSTETKAHKVNETFQYEDAVSIQQDMHDSVMVWKLNDFSDLASRISEAFFLITTFGIMLPAPDRPERDMSARKMLLDRPIVAEFVAGQEAKRKKTAT